MSESFQVLRGSSMRLSSRRVCSSGDDLEPVLHQQDPRVDHRLLDRRCHRQEVLRLLLGAEPHHPLDAGAVVPAAVEDHDLPRGGEVRDVPLDVHLRLLAFGGRRQRDDAERPRAHALGDRLDRRRPSPRCHGLRTRRRPWRPCASPTPAWRRARRAAGAAHARSPCASASAPARGSDSASPVSGPCVF